MPELGMVCSRKAKDGVEAAANKTMDYLFQERAPEALGRSRNQFGVSLGWIRFPGDRTRAGKDS